MPSCGNPQPRKRGGTTVEMIVFVFVAVAVGMLAVVAELYLGEATPPAARPPRLGSLTAGQRAHPCRDGPLLISAVGAGPR